MLGAAKMNVLHWHLTDDQGFGLQSNAVPKLALGTTEGGLVYSHADVKR